jgi:hypothetical protein
MNTRLSRKGVDLGEARNGGIFGLMDSLMKETCRISEDELDLLCDIATDDELDLAMADNLTFTQKRELLKFLEEKIYNKA